VFYCFLVGVLHAFFLPLDYDKAEKIYQKSY